MKLFKIAVKILCLILAVWLVLTAVFFCPNSVDKLKISNESFTDTELPYKAGVLEKIASSGFIELYFNKENGEIAVKETSQNYMWYALPQGNGAMVQLTACNSKGEYCLTSNGCEFDYTLQDNGVDLLYKIAKQGAEFLVTVNLWLKDGSLLVKSSVENLTPEWVISTISVLPDFCSFSNPDTSDFLLIPDGCGGVIYPAREENTAAYSVSIYGSDYSVSDSGNAHGIIGAFGIKNKRSAIAVIIDKGEELAEINAISNKAAYSKISASFNVNSVTKNGTDLYTYNEKISEISLCYKFLSGDNATYSDIASSCREQLIRNGSLPSSNVKAQDNTPLFLTIVGSQKKSPWKGYSKITTYSQALDILNRIKAKGIDAPIVRYTGVFKENSISYISSLGSKKELEQLYSFSAAQNIPLFADVKISAYQSVFGKADLFSAKAMNKSTAFAVEKSLFDGSSVKYRFKKTKNIGNFVSDLIKKADNGNSLNYCIGDGKYLISDFSMKHISRTDAKNTIASQIPALANAGSVMVDTGNLYLIKNSSSVINMPMTVFYPQSDGYVAVPFAQSVYHGRITMAGTPVNLNEDMIVSTLKCIEYGVCPSFICAYSNKNLPENIVFDNILNTLINCYSIAEKALLGIESERITQHEKLKEGVFLTTYGDTAKIYVNYNETPVTVNGIKISGKSYIRID